MPTWLPLLVHSSERSILAARRAEMADLTKQEVELAEFAFEVYGGADGLDSADLGCFLRACDLNPSLKELETCGATQKKGEKKFTLQECLKIFSDCKKGKKDQGQYEDFVELLKLYDKSENGCMLTGDLSHMLLALGEKLTNAEVDEVFRDCLPPENADEEVEYDIFLRRLTEKPLKD